MSAASVAAPALSAHGLVKRYGELVAVDGLDLEVPRGACLGLLGPNGAGKTTTIEILEGLTTPDAGEVRVLGRRWDTDPQGIRERIGVQLQETRLIDKLTARETLRMFASFYAAPDDLEAVLERVGLVEKADARTVALSGGQRQRLTLACSLVGRPELLFLDEPTTGLDPQARRRVWEIVEDFLADGGSVLLTTHYMEEAERLAQHLVIVDQGRVLVKGTPAEVLRLLEGDGVVELLLPETAQGSLDVAELEALPGVRRARLEGAAAVLTVEDTQASVGALLALLAERGLDLVDLRTHRSTLEDVFVHLTGRHLRDG